MNQNPKKCQLKKKAMKPLITIHIPHLFQVRVACSVASRRGQYGRRGALYALGIQKQPALVHRGDRSAGDVKGAEAAPSNPSALVPLPPP